MVHDMSAITRYRFGWSVLVVIAAAVPAFGQIPAEVELKIEAAQAFFEPDNFVGSYRITNNSIVKKTNGKDPQEIVVVIDAVYRDDGTVGSNLVQMVENGEDVTEKRRKKIEKQLNEQNGGGDEDAGEPDLIGPTGDHAGWFVYGPRRHVGDITEISFNPDDEHRSTARISAGKVAWNLTTMDPVCVEMTAVQPEKPLKELSIRFEFSRLGDDVFVSRVHTNGLAKVLLIKRRFDAEIVFSDVKPAR